MIWRIEIEIEIDDLDEMIETQQLQKLNILNYSFLLDS